MPANLVYLIHMWVEHILYYICISIQLACILYNFTWYKFTTLLSMLCLLQKLTSQCHSIMFIHITWPPVTFHTNFSHLLTTFLTCTFYHKYWEGWWWCSFPCHFSTSAERSVRGFVSPSRAQSHDWSRSVQLHGFVFGQHSSHQNCEVSVSKPCYKK